jgi:endonuclease V-like protein UPF0215 family
LLANRNWPDCSFDNKVQYRGVPQTQQRQTTFVCLEGISFAGKNFVSPETHLQKNKIDRA